MIATGCFLTVLACAYPSGLDGLLRLAHQGIAVIINLHECGHESIYLERLSLTEIHLPVPDFTAPTPEQLTAGVAAIREALQRGQRVAVHCAAGVGRTGTLLACYLVSTGVEPAAAIEQVRAVRPGSIEMASQAAAVEAFARTLHADPQTGPG